MLTAGGTMPSSHLLGDLPRHLPPFPTVTPASLAALKAVLGRGGLTCSGNYNGPFNLLKDSDLAPLVYFHRL